MSPDPALHAAPPDSDAACAEARRERESFEGRLERLRTIRRRLVDAGRLADAAARDADRSAISARKDALMAAWREARDAASDPAGRQQATGVLLRQLTALNHRTRGALRQLARERALERDFEADLRKADLEAAAARIRAEVAEAACAEARARRANAEEAAVRSGGRDRAAIVAAAGEDGEAPLDEPVDPDAPDEPDDETLVDAVGAATPTRPADAPAVRRLLAGDPGTHGAIAAELAEMSGQLPARYLLLLKTLVDELTGAAVDAGDLAFDRGHPLWSQFSPDEGRLVVRGLRDLGFRLDLEDGWFGGRAPTVSDLASALGFAGHDVRSLRAMPSGEQLRDLPSSVQVAAHDHLRRVAPDLTLEQMTRALGPRSPRLNELWDEWGRVRPLLLATVPEPETVVSA